VKRGILNCIDAPRTPKLSLPSNPAHTTPTLFPMQYTLNNTSEDLNFFDLFSKNQMPMDDPTVIFDTLENNNFKQLPNCYAQPDMIDLEELFLSLPSHACKSRGLSACQDCSFNIDNFLPHPIPQEDTIISLLEHNLLFQQNSDRRNSFELKELRFERDYHQIQHLEGILNSLGIEVPIVAHILSLVKKLNGTNNGIGLVSLESYEQNINMIFPATPSLVMSPSGLIKYHNKAFSKLVKMEQHLDGFCLYQLLDMSSILGILDLCQKYQCSEPQGFGRCNFTLSSAKLLKGCSSSVSVFVQDQKLWITAQFIPV
jgi:hypothetical protein